MSDPVADYIAAIRPEHRALFDRFCRYFGQPAESFPKTWGQLIAKCEVLVFQHAQERELDDDIG